MKIIHSSANSIWAAWVLATAVGTALGFSVSWIIGPLFSWDEYDFYFVFVMLFLIGLLVGFCQWLILRARFKNAWGWIPVTASMLPIGIYVGFLGLASVVPSEFIGIPVAEHDYLVAGCTAGILLGVFQWLSLHKGTRDIWRWILASVLSWGIGIAIPLFMMDTYARTSDEGMLMGVAFFFFVGAAVGVINGAFVNACIFSLTG